MLQDPCKYPVSSSCSSYEVTYSLLMFSFQLRRSSYTFFERSSCFKSYYFGFLFKYQLLTINTIHTHIYISIMTQGNVVLIALTILPIPIVYDRVPFKNKSETRGKKDRITTLIYDSGTVQPVTVQPVPYDVTQQQCCHLFIGTEVSRYCYMQVSGCLIISVLTLGVRNKYTHIKKER